MPKQCKGTLYYDTMIWIVGTKGRLWTRRLHCLANSVCGVLEEVPFPWTPSVPSRKRIAEHAGCPWQSKLHQWRHWLWCWCCSWCGSQTRLYTRRSERLFFKTGPLIRERCPATMFFCPICLNQSTKHGSSINKTKTKIGSWNQSKQHQSWWALGLPMTNS